MTANSLQFEMAESSRVAAERLNEAMRISRCWRRRMKGGDEAVAVAAVKVELAKKEEEVADLKQLLEEASVEFLMLGGANDRLEERELLKEQKVKAEEAKAQASNLQCQLDEMRGATSVDDSALMEEEVATLREEFEKIKKQELMCWMAETGSQMAVPGVSAGISITWDLFTGSIFHRQVKEERQVQAKELEAEKDRVDELLEEKAKLEHDRQVHATELEAKVEEQGKVIERLEETIADLSWR